MDSLQCWQVKVNLGFRGVMSLYAFGEYGEMYFFSAVLLL